MNRGLCGPTLGSVLFLIGVGVTPLSSASAASRPTTSSSEGILDPGIPDPGKIVPVPVVETPLDVFLFPVHLASRSNLNEYQFLADGGETFGFSVGYGRSWIVRLPPIPPGPWARAYVGAKLGAMKTERKPGRPDWDRRVVSGEICAAVAQTLPMPTLQRFSLVRTEDIPLASDPRQPLEGVGEARWFWTEIPIGILSTTTPQLVALYSPDDTLNGESRSPILSGARAEGPPMAWWRDKAGGEPPRTSTEAFQFPAVSYTPAVAIKLVPLRDKRPTVNLLPSSDRELSGNVVVFRATVDGVDIESAWLEISVGDRPWSRWGRSLRGAPYSFSVSRESLPRGTLRFRAAARDIWENVGVSSSLSLPAYKGTKP